MTQRINVGTCEMILLTRVNHKALLPGLLLLAVSGCSNQTPKNDSQPPGNELSAVDPYLNSTTRKSGWQLIDLTHVFDERTIFWPTERGFELEKGPADVTEAGYFYSANRFRTAEHGGTHIDAPIHFFNQRQTVDQIPLDRLVGPGVLIDVRDKVKDNRDYLVGVEDLRRWETEHGRQLVDVIVLIRTGFGEFWPEREQYLGTTQLGEEAVQQLHFPGLDPDAARWLVEHRAIKAIGIDTASIDAGQSRKFRAHVTLFKHNIPAFENVANLEQLPGDGFMIAALPMKIREGTGAPLRIVAIIDAE